MKRILLVDDDADLLSSMAEAFRPRFDVVEATGYSRALQFLKLGGAFDAVVADLKLRGDRSGLDLLRETRLLAPGVLRILISGNRPGPEIDDALRAGLVEGFVRKPVDVAALEAQLSGAISNRAAAPR
jgi:DNA-binding NtrC family response regulator